MSQDLVIIGKIVAPHGVRGDVRVIPLTDFPNRFLDMKAVLVGEDRLLSIETAKFHKQFLLLKFCDLNDRNAVEALRGHYLYIQHKDVMPLPEDNFYVFDIIGMSVYTHNDEFLGKVSEVIETGSNDVYVVECPGNRPLLVPALKKIVKVMDIANRRMVIQRPEEWDSNED